MLDPMDNKLKRSVEKVNIDWDKEEMWTAIEAELPGKKRGAIWLWLSLGLLLIVGSTALWYAHSKTKTDRESSPIMASVEDKTNTPKESVISKDYIEASNSTLTNESTLVAENKPIKNVALKTQQKSNESISNSLLPERYQSNTTRLKKITPINQNIEVADIAPRTVEQVNLLATLLFKGISPFDRIYEAKLVPYIAPKTKIHRPEMPLSFGLSIAGFVSKSDYHSTSIEYLSDSNIYQNLESLELNLDLTKSFTPKFSLTSGLSIGRDILKFEYTSVLKEQYNDYVPDAYVFQDENGEDQFISGTEVKTRSTTQSTLTFNQHWYASVPILLNWNQRIKKSSLTFSVGPSLRYDFHQNGRFAALDGSIQDIASDGYTSIFLSSRIQYIRPIKQNLALSAGVVFRQSIQEQQLYHNTSYDQQYLGLQVGIIWKI